jgi:hypothetical protein
VLARDAAGHAPVVDAVDRLHGKPEHDIDREARLQDVHDGLRRDAAHDRAREALARQRRVGDRRAVVVGDAGRRADGTGDGLERGALVEGIETRRAGNRALHRVAGDDLADIHEDGNVAVADLHQIEQHLGLPRFAHRAGIVEAIAGHRARPHAFASCHGKERHQQQRPDRASQSASSGARTQLGRSRVEATFNH